MLQVIYRGFEDPLHACCPKQKPLNCQCHVGLLAELMLGTVASITKGRRQGNFL